MSKLGERTKKGSLVSDWLCDPEKLDVGVYWDPHHWFFLSFYNSKAISNDYPHVSEDRPCYSIWNHSAVVKSPYADDNVLASTVGKRIETQTYITHNNFCDQLLWSKYWNTLSWRKNFDTEILVVINCICV